ncbi:MAG TPA: tRNA pseudouridine(55) synthase TruB [Terriglobales bacterium]|nr:tRNA pseudouridine(55) synthase TruB [Terriglobales bacterium]
MEGALIIDKPAGITSHDVVSRVRRIVGERRIGHTGTLDPFATGVLMVLIGRATRLAQFLTGLEKEYEAVIRLGYATDTGDATGQRVTDFGAEAPRTTEIYREQIQSALASLRGEIEQTPPMYSAKKIAGKRLYELARRGEEIQRKPVRVQVRTFELGAADGWFPENDAGTQDIKVRVVCSAGTYIRALAEDLGRNVGVGAHVIELRRTRIGKFEIGVALTLERLEQLAQSGSIALISSDEVLGHLPLVQLTADESKRVMRGIDLDVGETANADWTNGQAVKLRAQDGQLVAVGIYDGDRNLLHPSVVIR